MNKLNLKILHCIASMKGGGAERQLCYLAKSLVEYNNEVHVILLDKGINFDRLLNSGATVHIVKSKSNYDPRIIYSIFKILRQVKPDILQCWQRPMNLFASCAAILSGVPFIMSERTNPVNYSNSIKGILVNFITHFSSGIIANSTTGVTYWAKKKSLKVPVVLFPNILPLNEIQQLSRPKRLEGNKIIIVGRLSEEKNHKTLLKAISTKEFNLIDFQLLIVGDGALKEYLLNLAKELRIENKIIFIPFTLNVWELINSSSLFISLSCFEGMPNVVLECAAIKTPMILSNIPEHTSLFSSEDCLFVDQNDIQEISRNIIFALNNIDILKKKSENAFLKIKNLQDKNITPLYFRFYNSIIRKTEII